MSAVVLHPPILGHLLLRDLQNLPMAISMNKSIAFVALGHLFASHKACHEEYSIFFLNYLFSFLLPHSLTLFLLEG